MYAKVSVSAHGRTAVSTRGTGGKTRDMGKEHSTIQMEASILAGGPTIKKSGKERFVTQMELRLKRIG